MWDACKLLWSLLIGLFRSRATLEAENLVLRQQIIVLRRSAPARCSPSVAKPVAIRGRTAKKILTAAHPTQVGRGKSGRRPKYEYGIKPLLCSDAMKALSMRGQCSN